MRSYQDLIVWRKSLDLCKLVYELALRFPSSEQYGLVSQMRRAVVSIPSNLAEGYSRASRKEFKQFVSIALGSSSELETQLFLARDLKFGQGEKYCIIFDYLNEVRKMLVVLRRKL